MAQSAGLDLPDLIAAYARGPADLAALVAGVAPDQWRARPIPGKWSMLEVVCHLADADQVCADRMKRLLAMEKPLLLAFPESLYTQRLAYHQRDPQEELDHLGMIRGQMTRLLRTLPPEAWQRQGVHNEVGLVTLRQVVQTMVNHIPHHGRFIAEKRRALGG